MSLTWGPQNKPALLGALDLGLRRGAGLGWGASQQERAQKEGSREPREPSCHRHQTPSRMETALSCSISLWRDCSPEIAPQNVWAAGNPLHSPSAQRPQMHRDLETLLRCTDHFSSTDRQDLPDRMRAGLYQAQSPVSNQGSVQLHQRREQSTLQQSMMG